MNIIQQYEWRYIYYEELLEEIWDYDQRLINDVGVDCFRFCITISLSHHVINTIYSHIGDDLLNS